MTNPRDLLSEILNGETLYYGTVLCQNGNLRIWWSPFEWNSPEDGLKFQPEKWLCLGQSTWWGSKKQKEMYLGLLIELGDDIPDWPGEWAYFDNRPHLTPAAPDLRPTAPQQSEGSKAARSLRRSA